MANPGRMGGYGSFHKGLLREENTAIRQIEARGLDPRWVSDIILTHCDPDHAGGISDFRAQPST